MMSEGDGGSEVSSVTGASAPGRVGAGGMSAEGFSRLSPEGTSVSSNPEPAAVTDSRTCAGR